MDDEVELTEEQQQAQEQLQQLDERMPQLKSAEDYNALVRDDEENLVVVVATSSQCPHCAALPPHLLKLAAPRAATKNAKFYRFDALAAPDVAEELAVSQVPTFYFLLRGAQWESKAGHGFDKAFGLFKNHLLKRNELMFDHDQAKLPKPKEDDEEKEEGEEDEDEDDDE
jgi:thioredoxin-like negative regulator of GroEL